MTNTETSLPDSDVHRNIDSDAPLNIDSEGRLSTMSDQEVRAKRASCAIELLNKNNISVRERLFLIEENQYDVVPRSLITECRWRKMSDKEVMTSPDSWKCLLRCASWIGDHIPIEITLNHYVRPVYD